MFIEMTDDEARFLLDQMEKHINEMRDELAHTEHHALQHALAIDLDRLQNLAARLAMRLREAPRMER
jgi:hypothetical protein